MIDLTAAGLTQTESKCYTALLEKQDWKPTILATYVNETRTNCYKILDKLVEYGLAERFDVGKKLHYRATNPMQLLELARQKRTALEQAERTLQLHADDLQRKYYQTHEQAGIQHFQGEAEIAQIYTMIAQASEEVVFVHTSAGIDFYGFETMHTLRMQAVTKHVERRALTPDSKKATRDYAETDPQVLLSRTWLKADDYTAPVEWGAFDNKLYIISYGQEALGTVIESQQIADSFKQLFTLLERGQRLLPDYATLPRLAAAAGRTEPLVP